MTRAGFLARPMVWEEPVWYGCFFSTIVPPFFKSFFGPLREGWKLMADVAGKAPGSPALCSRPILSSGERLNAGQAAISAESQSSLPCSADDN